MVETTRVVIFLGHLVPANFEFYLRIATSVEDAYLITPNIFFSSLGDGTMEYYEIFLLQVIWVVEHGIQKTLEEVSSTVF